MKDKTVKKYLWSTSDGAGRLTPYVVIECDTETAQEIERWDYTKLWKFLADNLHAKYPHEFPAWWDRYGHRALFWYNNVLEPYDEAYERLLEETIDMLRDNFDNDESLRYEAEMRVDEELSSLPVYDLCLNC